MRFAWKARGNGLADTVTPDAWKLFKERVQQSRSILETAESLPVHDPKLYANLQVVALAQSWSRPQIDQLFQQAVSIEPLYFYYYNEQTNSLMPKWYGKPGEAEEFLHSAADHVGGPEGDFIYFRAAALENCCRSTQLPGLSWDRVKRGFAALDQLYGATNHQRNVVAYMAVAQHDREFAQQVVSVIGNDWDASVWHTKGQFETAKTAIQ